MRIRGIGVRIGTAVALAAVLRAPSLPGLGTAQAMAQTDAVPGFATVDLRRAEADVDPAPASAPVVPVAHRSRGTGEAGSPEEVSGRYAVMRDKRDTGCMLTLDTARVRGGARAQLAPGCRDQGIVVFDPTAWQVVGGALVLTARAGHKTRLEPEGTGLWRRSAKDGGKPLGLKHL